MIDRNLDTSDQTNLLEILFENSHTSVAHLDRELNFVRVNTAYARADGKDPAYFPGKRHFDLFPNAENERIFKRVVSTGVTYEARAKPFEYKRNPERGVSHWDWTLSPIKEADGNVVGLVLILLDVTGRIQARERSAELEGIMQGVPDFVLSLDRDARIIYVNREIAPPGFDFEVGKRLQESLSESEAPRFREAFEGVMVSAVVQEFELDMRRDGGGEYYSVRVGPILAESETVGAIFVISVISERIQLLEELREKKEKAEATSDLKTDFTAMINHELRTPLNAILSAVHLMDTSTLKPEALEYLEIIGTAGSQLRSIIENVMEFSRIERTSSANHEVRFNLRHGLREMVVVSKTQLRPNVKMDFKLPTRMPEHFWGDLRKLSNIVRNLLTNAVKFTEEGEVQLEVEWKPSEPRLLHIRVSDTGPGIATNELEKIFEPYTQVGSYPARNSGIGLGLAIVRKYVDTMGGTIGVESTPGRGSTFTVTLPLTPCSTWMEQLPDGPSCDICLNREKPDGEGRLNVALLRPLRYLIVEDNEINYRILKAILQREGLDPDQIDIAANEREAYARLRDRKYDLILLDLHLGETDGLEVMKAVRKSDFAGRVIAVTADASEETVHRCVAHGIISVVTKPINRQVLFDQLVSAARSLAGLA